MINKLKLPLAATPSRTGANCALMAGSLSTGAVVVIVVGVVAVSVNAAIMPHHVFGCCCCERATDKQVTAVGSGGTPLVYMPTSG